jgi:hypothetical protein
MRAWRNVLIFLAALTPQSALADDDTSWFNPSRPTWSVVGSVEGTHSNNAFFSPSDRVSDFYFEPDVTLRLDGTLTNDIFYRLYARTTLDAFTHETAANSSFALVGARLSRNLWDWTWNLSYENRTAFDGVYRDRSFNANDIIGVATRDFTIRGATITPAILVGYRHGDVAEVNRYRVELWLGAELPINTTWAVVSESFIDTLYFTDGLNIGRNDQIYSTSLGLKYKINDNTSLTTEVVYEAGNSNRAGLNYWMIDVGPRLDFAF